METDNGEVFVITGTGKICNTGKIGIFFISLMKNDFSQTENSFLKR